MVNDLGLDHCFCLKWQMKFCWSVPHCWMMDEAIFGLLVKPFFVAGGGSDPALDI